MRTRVKALCGAMLAALVVAACSDPEVEKREYDDNADRFFEQREYSEAIVEYRNAIRIDAKFGEARFRLAEAYEASGNARAAFKEFIRAADLLPGDVKAQVKAATLLLLSGQFEDAKTRVERVLAKDPKHVEAQVVLANSLAGLRDLEGAVTQIEEAIRIDPDRSQSYSNLAVLHLAQGKREAARAAFTKATHIDPKSVVAWLALANFQWASGDNRAAEASLERALTIDPTHLLTNRALAVFYLSAGRVADAERPLKAVAESSADPSQKLGLADYYLSLSRFDDAARVLEPLSKNKATFAAAQSRMAAVVYLSDKPSAHKMMEEVIAREPSNSQALGMKARWLMDEGKTGEALTRAQEAIKVDPTSATAHFLVGTLQATLRQHEAAIASFNEVLRLNPRAAQAQVQLSRLHLVQGAPDSAVQMAEGALANAPGSPAARASLARGLIATGKMARAETEVAALLKQYPKEGSVHTLDGLLRQRKRDTPGARRAFETALQFTPGALDAVSALTALDLAEKQVGRAKQRVERRLAADPNRPELLFMAAGVYAAERNLPLSVETLRKIIEIDPNYAPTYPVLARLYVVQGKLDAARDEYDRMVARNGKNLGARTMAAMIVHQQQNMPEAKKRYEQIIEETPDAAVAANNLAWIYAEEGVNLDQAQRLAEAATARLPDNAAAQDTLGWVYYRKELPQLAIAPFEKSIERDPNNPSYHYHLALALQKSGNVQRAREAVRQALKLRPDYDEAKRLLGSF